MHTNCSETVIRDYVKKRKVSGGTRSDEGRRCRDTFASLKKTCRKLGISFRLYLMDRNSAGENSIPPLAEVIRNRTTELLPLVIEKLQFLSLFSCFWLKSPNDLMLNISIQSVCHQTEVAVWILT